MTVGIDSSCGFMQGMHTGGSYFLSHSLSLFFLFRGINSAFVYFINHSKGLDQTTVLGTPKLVRIKVIMVLVRTSQGSVFWMPVLLSDSLDVVSHRIISDK